MEPILQGLLSYLGDTATRLKSRKAQKPPDRIDPEDHAGQKPCFWVRLYLGIFFGFVGFLLFVGISIMQETRIAEPVPNYSLLAQHRLDKPVTAFDILTDEKGKTKGLLVADKATVHYGRRVKELFEWRHTPMRFFQDGLPAPKIVGLSADEGRTLFVCADREDQDSPRGVTAGVLPTCFSDVKMWDRFILDTSFFRDVNDRSAHCLLDYPYRLKGEDKTARLVGAFGVGIYDPNSRSWLKVDWQRTGGLHSEQVYDLEHLPAAQIAVMGDGGIDFGSLDASGADGRIAWKPAAHLDQARGLVGGDVRNGELVESELTYVTAEGGLGGIHLDNAGKVVDLQTRVGEGRVPDLTRASLERAAEDRHRGAVWMVHQATEPPGSLSAALYQTKDHQMLGTSADQRWPGASNLTLTADPDADVLTAWIGSQGIRKTTRRGAVTGDERLEVMFCGLGDRQVEEIVVNQYALVAHARNDAATGTVSPHTIEATPRALVDAGVSGAWSQPYIGPRRFPGLTRGDLSAACETHVEGQPAIYFGTKNKGIGLFLRRTRELFRVHHSAHPDSDFRPPCDGTLDLAARGEQLFQVGANRTLAHFDGMKWTTLIGEDGIDIDPSDVKAVAADGKSLVIGTAERIGLYDVDTHAWSELPPVDGLERLAFGIGQLWAIDLNKRLFSLPLADDPNPSWSEVDQRVIDFYGDPDLVAVVAGGSGRRHLWIQTKDGDKTSTKRSLAAPVALPRQGGSWVAAAADAQMLYVAPHNDGIGVYNLANHEWKHIPFPSETAAPSCRLLTTVSGLWLLGSDNVLYFLPDGTPNWQKASDNVKWLDTDGIDVIVLTTAGAVQRSANGAPPMVTLVGDAFADDLQKVKCGIVYQQQLLVGTPDCVGRFEVNRHSWHTYEGVEGIVQFAYTTGFLYGLTGQGHIQRYSPNADTWEVVKHGGNPLNAKRIAASGGAALFILDNSGAVSVLFDNGAGPPVTLIAATRMDRGAVIAAAEQDRDLFVGLDSGRVAQYAKKPNGPWVWSTIFEDNSTSAGPIRQLLAPIAGRGRLVVVGDKVWLVNQGVNGAGWQAQVLLDQKGIDGAVGNANFFGLQDGGDENAQIWRVPLQANPTALAYLGQRFPKSDNPETLDVGLSGADEVFRVDEAGTLAQYDFSENGWTEHDLQNVREFHRVGRQLWAWVPSENALHQWRPPQWTSEDADKGVAHVVGDGDAMLIATKDGELRLRTALGDSVVLPSPPAAPLPIEGTAQITAAAEDTDRLFLAQQEKPLLSYDRRNHTWHEETPLDIVEIIRVTSAGGISTLFALSRVGQVYRYETANKQWPLLPLPNNAVATKLIPAGGYAAIHSESNGAVYLVDVAGKLAGSFEPRMIADWTAAQMKEIRAATELDGKLLLVTAPVPGANELWRYDPDLHAWDTEEIDTGGDPRHFLQGSRIWLVTEDNGRRISLWPVNPGQPMIGTPIQNLFDATSDGQSIWVVTDEHHVRKVGPGGQLEETGVPDASLPDGREVISASGIADQCCLLLDDGSVYHYDTPTRQWKEQIPALQANNPFKGKLFRRGDHRLILSRPQGEMWYCDSNNAGWHQLAVDENIPNLPPAPNVGPTARWITEPIESGYKYLVEVDGKQQTRTLEDGRFDWDLPQRVFVKDDSVWLDTPGGTRQYKRVVQPGGQVMWNEVLGAVGEFPGRPVDPVVFNGQRFACRRDAKGAFVVADEGVALDMKWGQQTTMLKPGENHMGAGFAHDVIHDVSAAGNDLWLATEGGAARLNQLPNTRFAEVNGAGQGLPDEDLTRIVVYQGAVLVRSQSGGYAARRAGQPLANWAVLAGQQEAAAKEMVRQASSIERCNSQLVHWQLDEKPAGQVQLSALLGGGPVPVTVGPNGFGFDRPQAFALTQERIRFWTIDGRAEINRIEVPGPLVSLTRGQRTPAFEGLADVIDDPAGHDIWLRTQSAPSKVWRFKDPTWEDATDADFKRVFEERNPNLTDEPKFRWDRNDHVSMALAGLNGGNQFATRFDAARGRFLLNIPHRIATFGNDLWVLTDGGPVQFDQNKRWANVNSIAVSNPANSRFMHLNRPSRLVALIDEQLTEYNQGAWNQPANLPATEAAVERADAHLVDGNTWQVARGAAGAGGKPMKVRLTGDPTFQDVVLSPEGLFDFEHVHDILDDNSTCISATDFGLVRSDAGRIDHTHFWKQPSPALRVDRWQQEIYAKLGSGSGQNLKYDQDNAAWAQTPADVFEDIDRQLVDERPWSWTRENSRVRVQLHANPNGIWRGDQPLSVEVVGGRFDFDTVYDVGQHDKPWLVTEAGLLSREGAPGLVGISPPQPFQPQGAGERSLFSVTLVATPVLFARSGTDLLECGNNGWAIVKPDRASAVSDLLQFQEARSGSYDVARSPDRRLDMGLHLPEDPAGLYKPIEFDPTLGLFTFDDLSHVTRQAGGAPAVLAGTAGGIARYALGQQDESLLRRLFCHAPVDGIGRVNVDGLLHAKRLPVNLLMARSSGESGPRYYRLDQDRWNEGTPQEQLDQAYTLEDMTLAFDTQGWQVLDLSKQQSPPVTRPVFDMRLRGQTVRLANLQRTGDAATSVTRFAHDVPLSVDVTDQALWVATRGGMVAFRIRSAPGGSYQTDPADFDLYSDDVVDPAELRGAEPVQGLVLVKAGGGAAATVFTRRADGTVLQSDTDANGHSWAPIDLDSPSFLTAARVAADSVWQWVKDGRNSLDEIELVVNEESVKVLDDYPWLVNGTWAFLETGHVQRGDPLRTMVFYRNQLYMATAGGVARFPSPSGQDPTEPDAPMEFVDAIFAVARDGSVEVPMVDVVQLHHEEDQDRLYARTSDDCSYVLNPNEESWETCAGDPLQNASVVVNNPLLRWMATDDGLQLDVPPLLADMPDQSDYPLFSKGKFSFDYVRHFAVTDSGIWLATDGGVCEYDRHTFSPVRFFASFVSAEGALPCVREIVATSADPVCVFCRTRTDDGSLSTFEFDGEEWTNSAKEQPFLDKYKCAEDKLMRFYRYPDGVLEAHLEHPSDAVVLGTGRGTTPFPLFAAGRFAFDHVRSAVLAGHKLWAATPAGVVEHELDWTKGTKGAAKIVRFYCYPQAKRNPAMAHLDRVTRLPNGRLITWNEANVFEATFGKTTSFLTWNVLPELRGQDLSKRMLLPDDDKKWLLARLPEKKHAMRVYRLEGDQWGPATSNRGRSVEAYLESYSSLDVSTAMMDDAWIYQPVKEGGLIRIHKSSVE